MIQAIALDDERPALDVLEVFSSQIDGLNLSRTFTRTSEARTYLAANPVDLIFLDINMPTESGVDFFRRFAHATPSYSPMVIFTTAYTEYAVESYDLQAVDYLLKPFTFERFSQAVEKARKRQHLLRRPEGGSPGEGAYLIFRVDYGLVKIAVADIFFIEGLDNYLKIHLREGHPVVVRLTMKVMMEKLPANGFIRVHRSYIVALDQVKSVRGKLITLGAGEEEIPLSSTYEAGFFAVFTGNIP